MPPGLVHTTPKGSPKVGKVILERHGQQEGSLQLGTKGEQMRGDLLKKKRQPKKSL